MLPSLFFLLLLIKLPFHWIRLTWVYCAQREVHKAWQWETHERARGDWRRISWFRLYSFCVHFEIIENGNDSCITKSTIEYDVKEEAVANTSYANTDLVAKIAEVTKNYLIKNKATENATWLWTIIYHILE